MRRDRLTLQYQLGSKNRMQMRKNLCSTENCKLSRIFGILCGLAFLFGIVQYIIYQADINQNRVSNDHSKILNKGPHFGGGNPTGGDASGGDEDFNSQEIINDVLKHIKQAELNKDGTKNVDGITHMKISDIEDDNHFATLGDDLDSSRHFDVMGDTAMGEKELHDDDPTFPLYQNFSIQQI